MKKAVLAFLLLTACQPNSSAVAQSNSSTGAVQANRPPQAPDFAVAEVAKFDKPFALAFLPGGDLVVTEKGGKLKLRRASGQIVDVPGVPPVFSRGQGGLMDLKPAPDFATSRRIYFTFANPAGDGSELALARATMTTAPALTDVQVLWRGGSAGKGGHYGSKIAFAPDGQTLFLAAGERQRFTPAQDPNQATGKIFRLTLDGQAAPGNPNYGKTGAATVTVTDPPKNSEIAKTLAGRTVPARQPNTTPSETWTTGHRNPYGLAFDGDGRLWEIEMGPKGGDELNLIKRGLNYGYPAVSHGDNYDDVPFARPRPGDGFEDAKAYWVPAMSPGGMIIYSGGLFPRWRGSALIAALSGEALIRVALDGEKATPAEYYNMGRRIRDVAQGPDGAVWLLADDGGLLRLSPR